jgi:hypothetical protein
MSVSTKRELCESEASSPLAQTLSPTTENGLGERAEIYGNADPGRSQWLLPLAAPWLLSDAPLGLYKEKAASYRFTNVQSPGPASGRRSPV